MNYSELFGYKPLHARFGESRVRQSASRITQSGKLGNGSDKVSPEDGAYFLYCLASSGSTSKIPISMEDEKEIINREGVRFVWTFGNLLSDERFIKTVRKIIIGKGCGFIHFNDGARWDFKDGAPNLGRSYEYDYGFLVSFYDAIKYPNWSKD